MGTQTGSSSPHGLLRRCEECGYDLRGHGQGQVCPECGHVPTPLPLDPSRGAGWRAAVTIGLGLLLLITLDAVASVLVQRSYDELLGILPALNVPGPKLWAVPLLQRPIGNAPELPGVTGSRTALAGLLAIWLITTRRPDEHEGQSDGLRLTARWVSVVLFGAAFGLLVSRQGLWPGQLTPYRALLVGGVELPATALLYLYLRRLSAFVPGVERRRALDALAWFMPGAMGVSALVLLADWLMPSADLSRWRRSLLPEGMAVGLGAMSLTVAVAAIAAVGSLASAFFVRAFPQAWRLLTGIRAAAGRMRSATAASADPLRAARLREGCFAAGLVLLVVVMLLGIDSVGWYSTRSGLGGNLPFYNFPGPKLWAAVAIPELGERYQWDPILSRTMLTALNLTALWLITAPSAVDRLGAWLKLLLRWLPVILLGVGLGIASAFHYLAGYGALSGSMRSEFFAAVTLVVEVPVTLLLYFHLARACRQRGWVRLRRQFLLLIPAIVLILAVAMAGLYFSRDWRPLRWSLGIGVAGALYGATLLLTTVWAVTAVLTLARQLMVTVRSA